VKALDIIVAILLVIGGLNWGLVGLFDFNLVTFLFQKNVIEKVVYIVVGVAAIYQIFGWKAIQNRWK
jgi:uncharacterized membrane protein YuzA (DUF378 family)